MTAVLGVAGIPSCDTGDSLLIVANLPPHYGLPTLTHRTVPQILFCTLSTINFGSLLEGRGGGCKEKIVLSNVEPGGGNLCDNLLTLPL